MQIITNNKNEDIAKKISTDSLTNFYKDKNDAYDDINENEVFKKINIDEDNDQAYGNKNKNKIINKNIKKYEEPIVRDKKPKKETNCPQ